MKVILALLTLVHKNESIYHFPSLGPPIWKVSQEEKEFIVNRKEKNCKEIESTENKITKIFTFIELFPPTDLIQILKIMSSH